MVAPAPDSVDNNNNNVDIGELKKSISSTIRKSDNDDYKNAIGAIKDALLGVNERNKHGRLYVTVVGS